MPSSCHVCPAQMAVESDFNNRVMAIKGELRAACVKDHYVNWHKGMYNSTLYTNSCTAKSISQYSYFSIINI